MDECGQIGWIGHTVLILLTLHTGNVHGDPAFYFIFVISLICFNSKWSFIRNLSNYIIYQIIERFSNDCQKAKTKAITPANHDRGKQRDEPITVPSNYLKLAQSAGKIVRTWCNWFCFSLAKNRHKSFKPITKHSNRNQVILLLTVIWKLLYYSGITLIPWD